MRGLGHCFFGRAMPAPPMPRCGRGPRRQRGSRRLPGVSARAGRCCHRLGFTEGAAACPGVLRGTAGALLSASAVPGCGRDLNNRNRHLLGARWGGAMGDEQCPWPGSWAVGVTAGRPSVPPPPLGQSEPSRGAAPE